jgi:hypothetical protein
MVLPLNDILITDYSAWLPYVFLVFQIGIIAILFRGCRKQLLETTDSDLRRGVIEAHVFLFFQCNMLVLSIIAVIFGLMTKL